MTENKELSQDQKAEKHPLDPVVRKQRNRIRILVLLLILLPLIFRFFTKDDILGTLTNRPYAKLLIAIGADVNSIGHSGLRPVFHAAANGRSEMLQFFIEQGADVKLTCSNEKVTGLTALHYAPNEEIASIHLAAYNSRTGVVKVLLEKGADPSLQDGNGRTALHEAAFRNEPVTALLLVKKGADVNRAARDGNTPVHEAVIWHNTAMVKFLLENGARCDLKNAAGFTPSAIAEREKFQEIIQLLQKTASADTVKKEK